MTTTNNNDKPWTFKQAMDTVDYRLDHYVEMEQELERSKQALREAKEQIQQDNKLKQAAIDQNKKKKVPDWWTNYREMFRGE